MRPELINGLTLIKHLLNWEGEFDPLNNRAHALKLAALLTIELTYDWAKRDQVVLSRRHRDNRYAGGWCSSELCDDPENALRHAISNTAACIGRDMLTRPVAPQLPVGTDAERPTRPEVGSLRPNVDNTGIEQFTGIIWEPLTLNQLSDIIDSTVKHSG